MNCLILLFLLFFYRYISLLHYFFPCGGKYFAKIEAPAGLN